MPPAGRAVNTSHPNHVIGHGTPASCTSAAVVRAVALGGIITFNCGPKPVTIVMTHTAKVVNTRHRIVLDGGGKVTLSGGGKIEILYMDTCDKKQVWTTSNCYDQQWPNLTVQNITFSHGYSGVHQGNGQNPYGGGAIYAQGGQFKAVNSRFLYNGCYKYGPDLGGAAIRALAQYKNRPVYITSDTFRGGRCSNGGALSSISVQWDVLNSVFTGNKAIGNGANPASSGTPGGGSGGAIYLDGVKDNVLGGRHDHPQQLGPRGRRRHLRRGRPVLGLADAQAVHAARQRQQGLPELPRHLLRGRWSAPPADSDQVVPGTLSTATGAALGPGRHREGFVSLSLTNPSP